MVPNIVNIINNCEAVCESMTNYVKRRPDLNIRMMQLTLLRDCADICGLTAKFIARRSPFSGSIAGLCAHICQTCGTECARFPDAESQNCAQVCFHCARECKEFSMRYS